MKFDLGIDRIVTFSLMLRVYFRDGTKLVLRRGWKPYIGDTEDWVNLHVQRRDGELR